MWRTGTKTLLLKNVKFSIWSISIILGGLTSVLKCHICLFFNCEELVRIVPFAKDWFDFFQILRICTQFSQMWRSGTSSSQWELITYRERSGRVLDSRPRGRRFECDAAHIFDLQSYSCPRFFNCKTYGISITCLNHVIKSLHICEELESNAKCSRFGGVFYWCKACACMLHIISLRAQISQNVRYWYAIYDVLVPIFHALWRIGTNFSQCERATCIKRISPPPPPAPYEAKI